MSRSYKKTPFCGDGPHCKKEANRRVRRYLNNGGDLANGSSYKKLFCQWEIRDYYFICTFQDYKNYYVWDKETGLYCDLAGTGRVYATYTEKELYKEWSKYYRRK